MIDLQTRVGEALGRRYAVEREVSAGGMGIVYAARDLKHDRHVAIKVLKPELRGFVNTERFHREIMTVARLAHPGILPVYDSGEDGELLYFVMPYVDGGSLRTLLDREEQLPVERALTMITGIGEAVAHAHAHGIVHRDLKPENILLQSGHPVIADFGIAVALDGESTRLSGSGMAIGTPAYMSPEQIACSPQIDGRADMYALGCILYEMLAGGPPFTGANPRSILARKLAGEFPRLKIVRPTVSRRLERAITRALAPVPADRFEDMERFLSALRDSSSRGVPRTAGIAAVVAAAVAGAGSVFVGAGTQIDGDLVVVEPFENRTGDAAMNAIGVSAADWITQGVQGTRLATVIPTPTALQASRYVRRQVETRRGEDPLKLLAIETGAGVIVSGSYYRTGAQLEFHVQLSDASVSKWRRRPVRVRTRTALAPVTVEPDSVQNAVMEMRARIMGLLALSLGDAHFTTPELDRAPPAFDAYQRFSEAMDAYIANDHQRAATGFLQAYERDTTFVVALLYAGLSMSNMQQYAKEDSVLRIVKRSSASLTTYDRLWLEFRQAFLAADRAQALRAVRALAAEAPRSKATYNLAIEAWENGHLEEALAALKSLPPEQGPVRGFLPYWGALANVHHQLGDYDSSLGVARQALERHPGKWWPVGWELGAMAALGQVSEVLKRAEAMAHAPEDDMRWSPAESLREAAEELRAHGHLDAAKGVWRVALRWYRAYGAGGSLGQRDRLGWAHTLYILGDFDEANRVARELEGDSPHDVRVAGLLGTIAARSGDLATARAIMNRLVVMPIRYQSGRPAYHAALIASALGETEAALRLLRQARTQGRSYGQWVHREPDLEPLRGVPAFVALVRSVPLRSAQ